MNSLESIRKELYGFKPIQKSKLEEKDAYISILRSIIPEDSVIDDLYQQAHRDFMTAMIDALEPTDTKPLTGVVAFEDFTKFCFYPNSHNGPMSKLSKCAPWVELILMKNEFVLFDPMLVHFGGSYTTAPGNLRLHIYLLSQKCGLGTVHDKDGIVQPLTEHRPLNGGNKGPSPISVFIEKSRCKRVAKSLRKKKRQMQGMIVGKRTRPSRIKKKQETNQMEGMVLRKRTRQ